MRNIEFAENEYYHLVGHAIDDLVLFSNKSEFSRFLLAILIFQAPVVLKNFNRVVKNFLKQGVIDQTIIQRVIKSRYVDLVAYTIMNNHYHLLVREVSGKGITQYMQRVLNAYGKFFNTKHERKGHVFQGPYKAILVESNEQLLYLSAYIHRNPHELKKWRGKSKEYPWSSYRDYLNGNTWGGLINPNIVLDQVSNAEEYEGFVEGSDAKGHYDEDPDKAK